MKTIPLLNKATEGVKFYTDKNNHGKYFVEFKSFNGMKEFTPIDSDIFKGFLLMKFFKLNVTGKSPSPDTAINMLHALRLYQHAYQDVDIFVRTSGNLRSNIEYDLKTGDHNTVKITHNSWSISPRRGKFIDLKEHLPQKVPVHTEKSPIDLLKPFVNISGDDFLLVIIWLVQSFTIGISICYYYNNEQSSGAFHPIFDAALSQQCTLKTLVVVRPATPTFPQTRRHGDKL